MVFKVAIRSIGDWMAEYIECGFRIFKKKYSRELYRLVSYRAAKLEKCLHHIVQD